MSIRLRAHSILTVFLTLLAVTATLPTLPAQAATEPLFVTATGHYVHGVFRDYWDKNGGLPIFGYPITDEYIDSQSGRVVQYFERARFERTGANATAVALGMLGREATVGRTFATSQPIKNTATRRYFPETKQIVQYGFKQIWETKGGLAIFGLPISGEIQEQADDGKTRTVQYFERVRFEYHPELPDGQRVLISLLGRKLAPSSRTAPLAPGSPMPPLTETAKPAPTTPSLVRPLVPVGKNALVYPLAGKPGDVFFFTAEGFEAGENVGVWANAPDGSVIGVDEQFVADANGTLDEAGLFLRTYAGYPTGVWSVVARGTKSEKEAVAYFLLVSSPLSNVDAGHPEQYKLPNDIDARAEPKAGPIGTVFFFDAYGFRAGEEVSVVVTAADGSTTNTITGVMADGNGSIRYAGLYYASAITSPTGVYSMVATGRSSGKRSVAYFMVYPL